jgi:CRP/FNR family transcriptional regulator
MSVHDSLGRGLPKPRSAPLGGEHPCRACEVRGICVCAVLEADELLQLNAISTTKSFLPNQPIFYAGDKSEHVSNVVQGAVRLYNLLPDGRRQITGFLFAGDFLGMAANQEYAYSAEALTTVKLCRFPRRKLEALLDVLPSLERRLLGAASNELVAAQDQMLLLGRKTAREKVASFLLRLSRRAVERGESADPVFLPMSRADIADYLGLTTETVSRTITNLRENGMIELLAADRISIAEGVALRDMAEGV